MSDRKVVLKMVLSLDDFATSPDGTHEWMFEWFGEDSGAWNRRALQEAGVHAMGRRSYEIMGPHWAASDGPIATAMNEKPRRSSPTPCRDGPGQRRPHLRPVVDPSGPRRRVPADDGPDRDRRGDSPFAELREHLKLEVVEEQRFQSGALAQALMPKRSRQ